MRYDAPLVTFTEHSSPPLESPAATKQEDDTCRSTQTEFLLFIPPPLPLDSQGVASIDAPSNNSDSVTPEEEENNEPNKPQVSLE
mmetsp:Transcript_34707/g.56728  ORF Transcript_34707/g.56728 Transcript_34707/m.56728 type:complete len:85 (-) Transcript_34707:48-302(-)